MNPLPVNVELLTQIANQRGRQYIDAYKVWLAYYQEPDVYTIVDTVLWVAQNQELSVVDAIKVVQDIEGQF
ncbi:hypothetical protein GO755_05115 [Spirosoma sp. HMF4905]|uniref:Uncharacterized protein n=1 Tax=Spirosoma arboris TaxID=2682092 RepID=A0A7K1S6F6_9BACT|nr:hypothetical protein [Spirosoma arboris]MVM29403.1 hypothetical protein [Spirosoma arboris]